MGVGVECKLTMMNGLGKGHIWMPPPNRSDSINWIDGTCWDILSRLVAIMKCHRKEARVAKIPGIRLYTS